MIFIFKKHVRIMAFLASTIFLFYFSHSTIADQQGDEDDDAYKQYYWWNKVGDKRTHKLSSYLENNEEGFTHFKDVALGSSGIPAILLRVFPSIFPEIWGEPEDYFAPVGLMQDPFNTKKALPLGIGHTASGTIIPVPVNGTIVDVNVRATQLTCMACHMGRVEDKSGNTHVLIGAPNNQFDRFRFSVFRTVTHPEYTADNFRAAIAAAASQGPGWLYESEDFRQQEALEAAIFSAPGVAENFLNALRATVIAAAQHTAATVGTYTYGGPNAPDFNGPQAGLIDAYSNGALLVLDPTILSPEELAAAAPPATGFSDIMSTWMQKHRISGQWDGSIVSPVHRNVASMVGVTRRPDTINLENAIVTNEFLQGLPAPAYPFGVTERAAKKGRKLFKKYCASCHYNGADTVFDVAHVGTDPNRAFALTDYTLPRLVNVFRSSCPEVLVECVNKNGEPFKDDEVLTVTGGYLALPLDGIWARAPYLHNGSVPTLAALLTGDRPAQFYRGNDTYDEKNVGFTWEHAETDHVMLYDTTLDGFSNAGHDTPEFNGDVDWANEPKKLYYLLEYLKTL